MSDFLKNFAIMMPLDIMRLPSGTPMVCTNPEEKFEFIKWFQVNMTTLPNLSDEEIQGVFKYWEQIKKNNNEK